MIPYLLRLVALIGLAVCSATIPSAARAEEAPSARAVPAVPAAAGAEDGTADEAAQRVVQVGIWSYDVVLGGGPRTGLVLRFEPDGSFDGTDTTWTREGRRVESRPLSGTWVLTSLGPTRWRLTLTLTDGQRKAAVFRSIDGDHLVNEFSQRVVTRVPHYADS